MWRLTLTRLLAGLPALLVVTALVFGIVRLIPGDPARILAGEYATDQVVRELRQRWQLDRPLPVQYGVYLGGLLRGDLGRSTATSLPVAPELLERFLRTIQLAAAAILIAAGVGGLAGVVGAVRRASLADYVATVLALAGVSGPTVSAATCSPRRSTARASRSRSASSRSPWPFLDPRTGLG